MPEIQSDINIWRSSDLQAELIRGRFIDYAYDVHTHETACFALLTEGQIRIRMRGNEFVAHKGDLYAIDADEPHAGWAIDAAFQWVNPKSWVMAAGAVTTYLPINFKAPDILLFAFLFALISFPCVGIWGCFGVGLKKMLKNSKSVKTFNYLAAALLIISLYPILR